jgi:hypothetical protein
MCHCWINTNFISKKDSVIILNKNDIDKAVKDKKCEFFDSDFKIELHFEIISEGKRKKESFENVAKIGEFSNFCITEEETGINE